ncbi:hypothetical protein [Nocardioides sp.]|uniref:hypothetical protein n=1 Tax=Nocardioides sp. TaxID=35761 RepID=UPI003D136A8C
MGFRKKKSLMDQAGDLVDQILPAIESAVDTAKEKAVPLYQDAKDRAVPLYQDAKDRAVPLYNDAVDSAKPVLAQGRALATEKAAQGAAIVAEHAATGRDLATAKVAEIKGEPAKKKGSKLKKVLVITGVAGIAAFVYKKLTASDDSWQSAYTPAPPPPAKPAAPVAEPADDAAAASPDEAIADAVEEPHAVTTPDDPAEVVEVEGDEGSSKS